MENKMAIRGGVSGGVGRGASALRNKFKQTLQQKTEQSYKTKDENASTFRDYYDKSKMDNVKLYRIGRGDVSVVFDIIPYIAGENDPKNAAGDPVYLLDINVHKNIGPMNDQIVCLAQYGKPCPVCEEIERRRAAGEDYESRIKPLKPSRRVLYNIIVRDNMGAEEKKGVQVWEIAHFFMEKKITGIAKNPRTGGIIVFSDPDDGRSISFSKRNPTQTTVEYSAHQLLERPGPITDDELNAAHTLDELIKLHTYKEIEDILYASVGSDDQGEDTPPEQQEAPPVQNELPSRTTERRQRKLEPEPAPEVSNEGEADGECPMGGILGQSIDEFAECMQCEIYDKCAAIADAQ